MPGTTPAATPGGGPGPTVELGAVLLDLDGTLVDTSPGWRRAYAEVAAARGATLPDGWWERVAGRSMHDSTAVLGLDPEREPERAAAVARELSARGAAALAADPASWRWRPGAAALLDGLRRAGLAHAVVTSVDAEVAGPLLAAMGAEVATLVTGDAVGRGKPAPDGYLRAADLLGVAPAACLVVEDSPTGVAAAAAAGMAVLAVPHAGPVDAAPGRELRRTLEGVTVAELPGLHARLRSDAATAAERGGER